MYKPTEVVTDGLSGVGTLVFVLVLQSVEGVWQVNIRKLSVQ